MSNITQRTVKIYGHEDYTGPSDGINFKAVKVGDEFILVEFENIMTGDRWYKLRPDNGKGIPGNLQPVEYYYHGWRGTTNNIRKEAHGLRKVIKVSEVLWDDNEGDEYVKVTVGKDIHPDWD